MSKRLQKLLAILLCLTMCMGYVPVAYAEGPEDPFGEPADGEFFWEEPLPEEFPEEPIELLPEEPEEELPEEPIELLPEEPVEELPEEPEEEFSFEEESAFDGEELFVPNTGENIPIDEDHFPDSEFRRYILENLNSEDGDTEEKAFLTPGEIGNVDMLHINNDEEPGAAWNYHITSLEGIKYFTSVTWLLCVNLYTPEVDLSGMTNLNALDLISCGIESLNITGCTGLTGRFDVSNNALTYLDMSGFSDVGWLLCRGNQIETLILDGCTNLEEVAAYDNQLTSISMDGCTALQNLEIQNNPTLEELDLSGCPNLHSLNCSRTGLTGLDLSPTPDMGYLVCNGCQLEWLGLDDCPSLETLKCGGNRLEILDLSDKACLTTLSCNGGNTGSLTSLNLSGCGNLSFLHLTGNAELTELDLSDCPYLAFLDINATGITELDISPCENLVAAYKDENSPWTYTFPGGIQGPVYGHGENLYVDGQPEYNLAFDPDTVTVNAAVSIPLDEAHFPDETFRAWLIEAVNTEEGDVDGNPILTEPEREAIRFIDCSGTEDNRSPIASLEGLQYFPNLEAITCYCASLENVYLSGMNNLARVNFYNNYLTSAIFFQCPSLGEVLVYNNPTLEYLELTECENVENLRAGSAVGANSLTYLDLSGLPNLKHLGVMATGLTELDLSNCPLIETLLCSQSPITTLNLEGCENLWSLKCSDTQIAELDLEGLPALTELECANCGLTSLDLTVRPRLERVRCDRNELGTLDLTGLTALTFLTCEDCGLQALNLTPCRGLQVLNCGYGNVLGDLDLSGLSALIHVDALNAGLTGLDLSGCTSLNQLHIPFNSGLTALDLSDCADLAYLDMWDTSVETLDLRPCMRLSAAYAAGPWQMNENDYAYGHAEGVNREYMPDVPYSLSIPENQNVLANEDAIWIALRLAITQSYEEYTQYSVNGEHELVIADGETFIVPENMEIILLDTTVIVEEGASLVISGGAGMVAGALDNRGSVVVDGDLEVLNDLSITGQALELNGNLTLGIDAWVEGGGIDILYNDQIVFGDDSLLDIWVEPADEAGLIAALDHDNPMFHFDHVRETFALLFPWSLDHDRTLDADQRLLIHYGGAYTGMLTIPEGMTLTLSEGSELFARGATENDGAIVQVNGTLINNSRITLQWTRAGLADIALGENGRYSGSGALTRDGEPYEFRTNADLFADLKATAENGGEHYLLDNRGDFEITEDLTIPTDFWLEIWGDTRIVVPDGVTLTLAEESWTDIPSLWVQDGGTVNVSARAKLNIDDLTLDGSILVGEQAGVNVNYNPNLATDRFQVHPEAQVCVHFHIGNEAELYEMKAVSDQYKYPITGELRVNFPWRLDHEFTTGGATFVAVCTNGDNSAGLTIAAGGVYNNGTSLNVRGGDIVVEAGGTLNNYAYIDMWPDGDVPPFTLTVLEGGSYDGAGRISVPDCENPDSHIVGIDGLVKTEDGDRWSYIYTGAILNELYSAIDRGDDYYDLRDCGTLTLTENLTIPDSMYVEGWGTELVVPEGVTLNIEGSLSLQKLAIRENAAVNVGRETDWKASLNIAETVELEGQLNFTGNAEADLPGGNVDECLEQISIDGENNDVRLHYYAQNADEILPLKQRADGLPEGFNPILTLNCEWVVNEELSFQRTNLDVDGLEGGLLTVGADGVLEIGSHLSIRGGLLQVNGRLVNHAEISLEHDWQGIDIAALSVNVEGGEYDGQGRICLPNDYNAENYIYGLPIDDPAQFTSYTDEWNQYFVYTGGFMDEIRAMIREAEENPDQYFYREIFIDAFTITEDLTIPRNLKLRFNSEVTVAEGCTLRIEQNTDIGRRLYLRGNLEIGDYGWVYINELVRSDTDSVSIGLNATMHTDWGFYETTVQEHYAVAFGEGSRILLSAFADNADEFYDQVTLNAGLPAPYHLKLIIGGNVVLRDSLDLTAGNSMDLHIDGCWGNGSLTVPAGKTLTTSSLGVSGGAVTVNGTLHNVGIIELDADWNSPNPTCGRLIFADGGAYSGPGEIRVAATDNPDAQIVGLDMSRFASRYDGGHWNIFTDKTWRFADFKAACEAGYVGSYDLRNLGDFVISEDITIPAGMIVETFGTTMFIIPEGVKLTVNGTLRSFIRVDGELIVNENAVFVSRNVTVNGTLTANNPRDFNVSEVVNLNGAVVLNDAFMNISKELWLDMDAATRNRIAINGNSGFRVHSEAYNIETLQNLFANPLPDDPAMASEDIHIRFPLVVENGTFTLPFITTKYLIHLNQEGSITVNAGAKLVVDGFLGVNNAVITVAGTLENNGGIIIDPRYGGVQGALLRFEQGSAYTGGGEIGVRDPENPDSYISGLNLGRFAKHMSGTMTVYRDKTAIFADFKAACEAGEETFDLSGMGVFAVLEDLTVPEGMSVSANDTTILINDGIKLTVEGELSADKIVVSGELIVNDTGAVTTPDMEVGGKLSVSGGFVNLPSQFSLTGTVELNNAALDIGKYAWSTLDDEARARITCLSNAGVRVHVYVNNQQSFLDNLNTPSTFPENIPLHVYHIETDCAIVLPNGTHTIPEDAMIHFRNGNLTIPVGATLRNNGILSMEGPALMLAGTLENNGLISLAYQEGNPAATFTVSVGGTYMGEGFIIVQDANTDRAKSYLSGLNLADLDVEPWDGGASTSFTIRQNIEAPTLVSATAGSTGIVFKWNAVDGAAKYRVYRKYGTGDWTAIGDTAATSYTDTNVAGGTTYTYTVCCLNEDGKVISDFDATGKSATAQYAAPVLISATATGGNIVFKWNTVDGVTKYRVYRKTGSAAWTALANVAATSYTDTNVTAGTTYTYTARCLNAAGQPVSGFDATGKSAKAVAVNLPTPTLISATAGSGGIVFKWNAVNGAAKYRVYRKTGSAAWTALANVSGTSYTDTNVTGGTTYTYTVRCLNAAGQTVSGFDTTGKSATAMVAAPVLISATATPGSIVFKWNAVAGAAKYRVYRKTGSAAWTALANVAATSYTDTNVTAGTTYTYTARCLNAAGQTISNFDTTGKSAKAVALNLATPTLVSATASGSNIVFKWNAVAGAAKYRVYRKYSGVNWTIVGDVAGTSYTDTSVTAGVVYTYTVRCLSAAGQTVSGFNATGKSAYVALATPTLVSATASGSNIVFKWNAVAGAAKYRVYRKYSGVNWTVVGDVAGTSYTDTSVTAGVVYTYTVRCLSTDGKTCVSGFNATGKSAYVSLPAPTLISATKSGSSIVFKWNAVAGAAKYRVYRKTANGSWTALANVSGTSYTDTNVTAGTTYTYTVRCLSADGKTCVSGFNATGKSATA